MKREDQKALTQFNNLVRKAIEKGALISVEDITVQNLFSHQKSKQYEKEHARRTEIVANE